MPGPEEPIIKGDICFADSIDIAVNSLKDTYDAVESFSDAKKLMLFGVDGWNTAANTTKFSKAFESNRFDQLEIFGSELGLAGEKALAEGLKKTGGKMIKSLELDNCPLTKEGAKFIIESVNDGSNVSFLNLQGSVKEAGALEAMAKALESNATIEKLDLKINDIKREGAEALSKMFQMNNVLIELDLFYNDVGPEGAQSIANALRMDQCALRVLNLCCNKIQDVGACELGSALRTNRTLEKLELALNDIKDDGAKALCEALNPATENAGGYNNVLKYLDISANLITKDGGEAIASLITYNRDMDFLDFTGIEPTSEGWEAFVSAFTALNYGKQNATKEIKFSIVDIDDDMLEKVERAIDQHPCINYRRKVPPKTEDAAAATTA